MLLSSLEFSSYVAELILPRAFVNDGRHYELFFLMGELVQTVMRGRRLSLMGTTVDGTRLPLPLRVTGTCVNLPTPRLIFFATHHTRQLIVKNCQPRTCERYEKATVNSHSLEQTVSETGSHVAVEVMTIMT